ncbi:MAG: DUF4301 family protein [Bacteroidales bacterium]
MLTKADIDLLASKGISKEQLELQLEYFRYGFPYIEIKEAATPRCGIMQINDQNQNGYIDSWSSYLSKNPSIVKFVPASGAATRMFKNLYEFLDTPNDAASTPFERTFFDNIENFAFFNSLNSCCSRMYGKDVKELIDSGQSHEVVRLILCSEGLNYGALPKGLLEFHKYIDSSRTPVEEHLVEGAMYAANSQRNVSIHFTVSAEHRVLFQQLVDNSLEKYNQEYNANFHVAYSEQKSSTDTIAVDLNNEPFRENGKLLFRPAGHGALIENLNEIDADIIFIKNIDNVVPDSRKEIITRYKQVIAGLLVEVQSKIFDSLKKLDSGSYTREDLNSMVKFLELQLTTKLDSVSSLCDSELAAYLHKKFNRPTRVCGMVRNVGEPGGGPFITLNSDGSSSLQILESSQIDLDNPNSKEIFESSTHFNPVDLVCAVKDYKGERFDLTKYVDPKSGFISYKSKSGRDLKALELPGLWNGAMSDWNSIFVEVPIETFNPVKTVNDLLRPEHQ